MDKFSSQFPRLFFLVLEHFQHQVDARLCLCKLDLLAACLIRELEANDAVVVAPQILDLRTTVRVKKKRMQEMSK